MANLITYNQVIGILKNICERHYQINSFYLGRNWELENDNDIVYPVFQVYPESARMPVTNGEYKTIEMRLICKVVDLVKQDESNEKDVHSDCLRIAQDIINEFNQHPFYIRSNASLTGDINITNLEEFEDDFTAGWEFGLTLKLININSYCGLPFEEITGYSASGPESTGFSYSVQYLTCDTLTACTSLQDYVENAISNIPTGNTANYYTTGATFVGTIAFFDRNDQLSAYTLQLSGLTSGITATGNYLSLSGGTVTGNTIFQSNLTITGITESNTFKLSSFSSNPQIYADSDTNTGIMFDGPDILSLHTGGAQRILINASGQITNGSQNVESGFNLYFSGNSKIDNLSATTITTNKFKYNVYNFTASTLDTTYSIDFQNGDWQNLTFNTGTTLTYSNAEAGGNYTVVISASGSTSISLSGSSGWWTPAGMPIGFDNEVVLMQMVYDGTRMIVSTYENLNLLV